MSSSDEQARDHATVVVVGAGPVGMLIALRLGQAGIDTLILESHEKLLPTTRACVYMPMVLPALQSLDILDRVKQEAYLNPDGVTWRDMNGKALANLPLGQPPSTSSSPSDDFVGVLNMGQSRLNEIILEALEKYPTVTVRYGLKLTSIVDDPSSPTVQLTAQSHKAPDTETKLTTSYIVGTDGANSTTRQLMGLEHIGFTWPNMRMIGIDAIYDFTKHNGFTGLNFVVHPTDWAVIAYTGQHEGEVSHQQATKTSLDRPQWRVAYVEDPSLPSDKDSIMSRAEEQMKKYTLSGQPFKLLRAEPYTIGQRHATAAIKGRAMLAGDALHSNNPVGGLGLTGGILDAYCYGNALVRAIKANDKNVLEECAESRLRAWTEATDPISQGNIKRLFGMDANTVEERDALFARLNGGEEERNKAAGMMRNALEGMMVENFGDGVEALLSDVK